MRILVCNDDGIDTGIVQSRIVATRLKPNTRYSIEVTQFGQGADPAMLRLSVAPALRDLPERERAILYLRFFEGLTQTEIADQLGISQMHVSRLVSQSLEKLRRKAGG